MRSLVLMLAVAAAAPASAQIAPPLSFETGKLLPMTPGAWTYVATATGGEARYGNVLIFRCNGTNRTVQIERVGSVNQPLTIATSSLTRAIPGNGVVYAADNLLDAIAFSRGRFLVAGGIGPILAVPSWPEAAKAVEDCRI